MPDLSLKEIEEAMRARLDVVRDAKQEHDRLTAALAALEAADTNGAAATPRRRRGPGRDPEAPYGRKADGTPRKRPGRSANTTQNA